MENYFKTFDELTSSTNITCTYTGRDGTFLIYAFCKEEIDFLTILDEINILALKPSVNEFWGKRSFHGKNDKHYKKVFFCLE